MQYGFFRLESSDPNYYGSIDLKKYKNKRSETLETKWFLNKESMIDFIIANQVLILNKWGCLLSRTDIL